MSLFNSGHRPSPIADVRRERAVQATIVQLPPAVAHCVTHRRRQREQQEYLIDK